jgi:thiosulfate/3-mercaptopyruvate sulfurtransferase
MRMRTGFRLSVISLAGAAALFAAGPPRTAGHTPAPTRAGQAGAAFASGTLIQPAALAKELQRPKGQRPVVLHVGFAVLYQGGHIPGAIHAGPAMKPAGLAALRHAAERISRGREVVIYCGCCPMTKCPNIHPAYNALKKMGFRHLKVLDLPQDFAHDWVEKGLPTTKGTASR